jgi:hypothetical protein
MDESGDLWFDLSKDKTSRFFLITCVCTQNPRTLEKVVKKWLNCLKPNERDRLWWTLHSYKINPSIRYKVLTNIAQTDCSIYALYIDKKTFLLSKKEDQYIIYANIVQHLLSKLITSQSVTNYHFVASRLHTNRLLNDNFREYVSTYINHHVSWSLFRYIEHGDVSYMRIIQKNIASLSSLFS